MRSATDIGLLRGSQNVLGFSMQEIWILLGAIGVLVALVVCWVVFIRKPKRERSRWPGVHSHSPSGSSEGEHRHRRRRRRHRRRNPTLAETGGLPPVRRDTPPGP